MHMYVHKRTQYIQKFHLIIPKISLNISLNIFYVNSVSILYFILLFETILIIWNNNLHEFETLLILLIYIHFIIFYIILSTIEKRKGKCSTDYSSKYHLQISNDRVTVDRQRVNLLIIQPRSCAKL